MLEGAIFFFASDSYFMSSPKMSQTYENDDVARFFHYPAKVDFCTSPSFG